MKKLILIFFFIATAASPIFAAEPYDITVWMNWEQPGSLEYLGGWRVYVSEYPEGPYEIVSEITYDGGGAYQETIETVQIYGSPNSTVTLYFAVSAYWVNAPMLETDLSEEASVSIRLLPPGKIKNG